MWESKCVRDHSPGLQDCHPGKDVTSLAALSMESARGGKPAGGQRDTLRPSHERTPASLGRSAWLSSAGGAELGKASADLHLVIRSFNKHSLSTYHRPRRTGTVSGIRIPIL